jgi:signal transduction histidine kinase
VSPEGTATFGNGSEGTDPNEAWARSFRILSAISQQAGHSTNLPSFFGALTKTIARLTVARRAAFWMLQPDSAVVIQPDAFGFSNELLERMRTRPCGPDSEGATHDVLFADRIWRSSFDPDDPSVQHGVVVPWRSGEQQIGLLGVYDSARPTGFTEADVWVARMAGLAAGPVWQDRRSSRRLLDLERQQARRLREYAERVAELEKVKSNVLNLAAHELRGPLGVIRGYLSLLRDGSIQDADMIRRILPVLDAKADEMSALVDGILEAARLDEGRIQLNLARLDVRDVLTDAVAAINLRVELRHRLVTQTVPHPVLVMGDRGRLTSIVTNLLDNAIKYSPSGGPIHCGVRVEKAVAIVSVIDRGIGISENDLPTLFTRFGRVQSREGGRIAGIGLGLYLSRELALMHGGDIAVESEPGVGSAFNLVLPRVAPGEDVMDAGPPPAQALRAAGCDVTRFGLSDMVACGAAFREIGRAAATFEEAANGVVRHLYDTLRAGEDGPRALALVRLYRATPLSRLDAEQRELARRSLGGKREGEGSTLCLTLAATIGEREEWCDPAASRQHRVIPLPSGGRWCPMIVRLVRDLGLDRGRARDPDLFLDMTERTCNVFHVPEAVDSPHVPAQEEFVRPYGIESVLGFGGILAPRDLYVVILFSKAPIPRASASLFRAISHSAKLALQRFATEATPAATQLKVL